MATSETDPTPWLTVEEAAARVQVRPAVIDTAITRGHLQAVRADGRVWTRREWVDGWLRTLVVHPDAPGD